MLEVRDLHKYYGSFHAVRGIGFDVARGEIVGFLGPNGAGKTTTMKIIVGYMTMSAGEVRVDGLDVIADSLEVRSRIGYLPENAPLYDDMTVSEYLAFIADMRGLRGPTRKERIDHVMGVCSLEEKRSAGVKTLSKGFRQRVGLAQSIIHDPKLVILDEPTVGLDPNQVVEIRELIREIGQRNTVILSSHILSEVEATCSRVLIVHRGDIVANGGIDELEREHGERGVEIEIEAPAKAADELAAAVSGKARVVPGKGERLRLFIATAESDAAGRIVELAAKKGWRLHEATRRRSSLEDVFRTLTTENEVEEVRTSAAEESRS